MPHVVLLAMFFSGNLNGHWQMTRTVKVADSYLDSRLTPQSCAVSAPAAVAEFISQHPDLDSGNLVRFACVVVTDQQAL
jgi:hypothetical protein